MCSHSETLTTKITVKHSTTINRSLTEVKAVCYEILLDKLRFLFHLCNAVLLLDYFHFYTESRGTTS